MNKRMRRSSKKKNITSSRIMTSNISLYQKSILELI